MIFRVQQNREVLPKVLLLYVLTPTTVSNIRHTSELSDFRSHIKLKKKRRRRSVVVILINILPSIETNTFFLSNQFINPYRCPSIIRLANEEVDMFSKPWLALLIRPHCHWLFSFCLSWCPS